MESPNMSRMLSLIVWVAAIISCVKCRHHVDLEGSEDYTLEHQEKLSSFHRPLLSHYLSPFLHHPRAHKFVAAPNIKVVKPTVTSTKIIVLQTIRQQTKHKICYKAPYGLPSCLRDYRKKYISPTSVTQFPPEGKTQFLGYLEEGELKKEKLYNIQEDIDREQRHLYGKDYFKHTKYETKTLWITRVEEFLNTQVTATMLAFNCAPCHEDIPPCPEKVDHYIHFDLSEGFKPTEGKNNNALNNVQEEISRGNSKEFILEERSKNESAEDVAEKFDETLKNQN